MRRVLRLLAIFLVFGCDTGTEPPTPSEIVIAPGSASLSALGETQQFTARVLSTKGTDLPTTGLAWSSNNPDVASITSAGLATAHAVGTATISARLEGISGAAQLSVQQVPAGVTVTPNEGTLEAIGDTLRLVADVSDENGHHIQDASVVWASSEPGKVSVTSSGLIAAHENGTADITASAQSASGTASITVHQRIQEVTLSPDSLILASAGGAIGLEPTVLDPAGATVSRAYAEVWRSMDESVATVSAAGLVSAAGVGETKIVVEIEDVSSWASVEIKPGVSDTIRADEGGELVTPSGFSIEIPPGELPSDVLVTALEEYIPLPPISDSIQSIVIEPSGLEFTEPVRIRFPVDGDPATYFFGQYDQETQTVGWVPSAVGQGGGIEAYLRHFSVYTALPAMAHLNPNMSYIVGTQGMSDEEAADALIGTLSWRPFLEEAGINMTFDSVASDPHIKIVKGPGWLGNAATAMVDLAHWKDGQFLRLVVLGQSLDWRTAEFLGERAEDPTPVPGFFPIFQSVVQHEVGHLFGLDHPSEWKCTGYRVLDWVFSPTYPDECLAPPIMSAVGSANLPAFYVLPEDLEALANEYEFPYRSNDATLTVERTSDVPVRGLPNAQVDTPPGVKVTDADGDPVPDVPVLFYADRSSGSVVGRAQSTDEDGIARPDSWILGSEGTQRMLAWVNNVGTWGIDGELLVPARLEAIPRSHWASPGTTIEIGVRVLSTTGFPVPGWEVTFTVAPENGTLSGGTILTAISGPSGEARVTWTLPVAEGEFAAHASAVGQDGEPLTDSPVSFLVETSESSVGAYFPLSVGRTWTYLFTQGASSQETVLDQITGVQEINGTDWYRACGTGFYGGIIWSDDECDLWAVSEGEILVWGDEGTEVPAVFLKEPLEPGVTWTYPGGGDVFTIREVGDERTVNGTLYGDVIRVEAVATTNDVVDVYFARGVGIVEVVWKEEYDETSGTWTFHASMELISTESYGAPTFGVLGTSERHTGKPPNPNPAIRNANGASLWSLIRH